MGLQIGQVSRRTGLSVDTIRFYERRALLPVPLRTAAGYRMYAAGDIERLQFIGRAQDLGFSLGEIRELLLIESGDEPKCPHIREVITAKLEHVAEKMAQLHGLQERLEMAQGRCDEALGGACGPECPVLKQLSPEVDP